MEVVTHDDEAEQLPAVARDGAFEVVEQSAAVVVVLNDVLAGVATGHHVVDGAVELDAESPWHGRMLSRAAQ